MTLKKDIYLLKNNITIYSKYELMYNIFIDIFLYLTALLYSDFKHLFLNQVATVQAESIIFGSLSVCEAKNNEKHKILRRHVK